MNFKKLGIIAGSIITVLYVLFLTIPFFLTGLANSYNEDIASAVEQASGFKLKFNNIRIITTPKLTAGVQIGALAISQPDGEEILNVSNARAKLSLLPLLIRRIEADILSAASIEAVFKVKKDGHFLVEEYIPEASEDVENHAMTELPYGFKLSNHLPDIRVKNYNLSLVDMRNNKKYSLNGKDFNITDFILNKHLKAETNGSISLDETIPFNYNIKLFNKIMPDIDINDLIFNANTTVNQPSVQQNSLAFNIIDILEGIRKNQLGADVLINIKTTGNLDNTNINGLINVDKLTLAVNSNKLPEGHIKLDFQGNKLISDIALYTAENELTSIIGDMNGKSKKINLAFKSNAQINNIFSIVKSVASSFNYNELNTLSATGTIDADFNLKSNIKKISSSGYFKVPSASVNYGLYNILIDKISADVDFAGDLLNIKNIGFEILSQPLKIYGTIKSDTTTDLHLKADKLLLKGLLAAAGQVSLLKENEFKSGTLSVDAFVDGKFKELKPWANILIDNLNILNKPSSITLKLPSAKITADSNDINIDNTYLVLQNSHIDIFGKISDYLGKNLAINLQAKGNLLANDLKSICPVDIRNLFDAKGLMPLNITLSGDDKRQIAAVQLLANPSGYFRIADVSSLRGKSTLINSNIVIADNNVKLENSGVFVTNAASLPVSISSSSPILTVNGGIDNLSNPHFNTLNITTNSPQMLSIPGFKNSKAVVDANITLNGNLISPTFNGSVALPEVSIPAMKTSLKNITASLGKVIDINLPHITVDNSTMSAKASISSDFTNGITVKSADFNGDYIDADTLAAALSSQPVSSGAAMGGASKSPAPVNLGVILQKGQGKVSKFKTGNIIATNLTSDFGLKNNVFNLKNLKGDAFAGKINGDISVNIISGKTSVKMNGSGLSAVNAIEGAAGIPNALSGILGFNADLKLNAFAPSYNAMLNSISGAINFDVKNGYYANIGRLDNLLLAKNLAANAILKAALAPIRNMPVIQNTSEFVSITGALSLKNGVANINSIKSSGPSMAYFVKGSYNLISGYTNVIVLGRLGADVVAALGPLGQLSVNKLTSYIPKFGTQTASLINALTSNPNSENISQIPSLTSQNTNTKDFKVVFVGNVTSLSSIQSFKWLTNCDISGISGGTLKEQLKTSTDTLKNSGKTTVQDVKKSVDNVKETAKNTADDIKNQVQKTKDSIQELKNLKNIFKAPAASNP